MAAAKEAIITMTVKQAIGLIVGGALTLASTLVVTAWVLWSFTMGSLQNDVADIRAALTKTQDGNEQTRDYAQSTGSELKNEFGNLTAELKITNSRLNDLSNSVTRLDGSIQSVDMRLSRSVDQQTAFERWVAIRLGPAGTEPAKFQLPPDWEKQQNDIFTTLTKGDDPFTGWFKAVQSHK
ncbi:hypothetical protein LB553_05475 [Mesorhizobium sp. CA8]|uniref:hypothetical protein n=1 Tax=Mesorhizobium sp. CA8 TaxID=2876637 RepID=UPI001CCA72F8|nr:hypothetical protein [Mesorhizobium sp. CA8]MBZ9760325.1 hypothetical protein [Mesorhizobium sp. CA8]